MEPMTDIGSEQAGTNQVTISWHVCNYEPCGLYSYPSKFVQVRNDTPDPALHMAPPSIAPEEYFSEEKSKAKLKFRVRLDSCSICQCSSYVYVLRDINHCILHII